MKHNLIYNDDKSSKFWQIEVSNTSFTVTYGKIGTNGQSSTKEFADTITCEKEANKLLAEKIKKGYGEINNNFTKRFAEIPDQLSQLILKKFPEEETSIDFDGDDSIGGAEMFVNNENQIIGFLEVGYLDSEQDFDEEDEDEDPLEVYEDEVLDFKNQYAQFFTDAVSLIKSKFGTEPEYIADQDIYKDIPGKLPEATSTDEIIFEASEEFFSHDTCMTAYWPLNDRIAFVQYAYSYGDGDFQIVLFTGVVRKNVN